MCIFCKIAKKEIPSNILYEDDTVLVFLDISQAGEGHALVVPKKHFANILVIDDYDYMHTMAVAKKVACVLKKTFSCDGINILNNCGEVAGQTVDHFHVHVIPRYNNDNVTIKWKDNNKKYSQEDFEQLKNRITANF